MYKADRQVVVFLGCKAYSFKSVLEASKHLAVSRATLCNRIADGKRLDNGSFVDEAIEGINYGNNIWEEQ